MVGILVIDLEVFCGNVVFLCWFEWFVFIKGFVEIFEEMFVVRIRGIMGNVFSLFCVWYLEFLWIMDLLDDRFWLDCGRGNVLGEIGFILLFFVLLL